MSLCDSSLQPVMDDSTFRRFDSRAHFSSICGQCGISLQLVKHRFLTFLHGKIIGCILMFSPDRKIVTGVGLLMLVYRKGLAVLLATRRFCLLSVLTDNYL